MSLQAPYLTSFCFLAVAVLRRDAEERGEAFNARPYFRACAGLIAELAPVPGTGLCCRRWLCMLPCVVQLLLHSCCV